MIEVMQAADEMGTVLLGTWQAFVDLPRFPRRSNWQVIIDEVPQLTGTTPSTCRAIPALSKNTW